MVTQASGLENEQQNNRALNTPLDKLIVRVANAIGGSKAKEVERFLKFAFVGVIGAMIDVGIFNLLGLTILPASEGRINVIIAASISFVCAVLSNFVWNRFWTYPDSRSRPIAQQLGQFALVSLTGWTGRSIWLFLATDFVTGIVTDFVTGMGINWASDTVSQLGATVAVLMGIFVIMIWNFLVNRFWTYNDVD